MLRSRAFPVFRRYALHIRILWQCAPAHSLACLTLAIATAAAGSAALVTTGRLVESLASGPGSAAATSGWLLATTAAFIAAPVAAAAQAATGQAIAARYLNVVVDRTLELGTRPYGIAHLEDPRSAGELHAVARAPGDWLFMAGIRDGWTLLSIRLGGVGAFVVLTTWSWWAPVVLMGAWLVLSKGFAQWGNTIFDNLLEVTGNDRRRAHYLRSLLTQQAPAKEVRLFGLTDWLVGRYVTAWQSAMRPVWARRTRGQRTTLLVMLIPLAANALVLAFLANDAWTGALSTGAIVTLAQAVLAMGAFGAQQDAQLSLARTLAAVSELDRLRAEQHPRRPRRNLYKERPASIALRSVRFTYPSADRATVSNLSLTIPAGQSIALVGVNGVGKSTLIKLLCGLYRPDHGTVRIDGADPGQDESARQRVAVIFQDFVRYHLSLRDNIDLTGTTDRRLMEQALHAAGGDSVLARLEHGWDTILSAEYDNGTDLSGGQWQRVALARALAAVAAGAGVLVLDEPTSALDVRVEAALFDRLLDVTHGVTTILVSHRLSSVRRAERIVVLGQRADGGGASVIEDGTHEQLLAQRGVYAEMFSLQASRFVQTGQGR